MITYVNVYKMHQDVHMPYFGTDYANCFDIEYFPVSELVFGYNEYNAKLERWTDKSNGDVTIYPGERLLMPTGLIFSFGKNRNLSLRLHSRSGLALKKGLILANGTGIVDVDYTMQVFALLANVSTMAHVISKHERICQGEITENRPIYFSELENPPEALGNRTGGFGSTGTK
jgi:dUTP pyrophosphatase